MIFQIIIIIGSWTLFGILHSIFASLGLKNYVRKKYSWFFPYYRFVYTLLQTLIFFIFWWKLPRPEVIIWHLEGILYWFYRTIQMACLAGIYFTFRQFRVKEFTGLSQISRFLRTKSIEKTDERYELNTKGMYSVSRHPVYLFSILVLCFNPVMTLYDLIFTSWVILYINIASYLEENKLIRIFGEEYQAYQKAVSRIFPLKWISNISVKLDQI